MVHRFFGSTASVPLRHSSNSTRRSQVLMRWPTFSLSQTLPWESRKKKRASCAKQPETNWLSLSAGLSCSDCAKKGSVQYLNASSPNLQ